MRLIRHTQCWLRSAALIFSLVISAGAAAEITFLVNSDGNAADENSGDGTCSTGDFFTVPDIGSVAECTLRAAVEEANEAAEPVRIEFADYIPVTDDWTFINASIPTIENQVTIAGDTHPLYSDSDRIPRIVLWPALSFGFDPLLSHKQLKKKA